jgi:hypothetical protein
VTDAAESYPRRAFACEHCLLLHLGEYVSREKIFSGAAYFSPFLDTLALS